MMNRRGFERTPGTLLLVDDEVNILSSLRRTFRPDRHRVLMAQSGAEGLAIMKEEPVDLILSDMRMPGMSGAEFLAEVAQNWPDTIRFLLTGYADLGSTVDAINRGHIYGYFGKPWDDTEIRLAIHNALAQIRLEQERRRLDRLAREQNAALKALNATLEERVNSRTEELRQANLFLELTYKDLKATYFATVPIFCHLLELREGADGGHSRRTGELAHRLALKMGLDEDEAQQVRFAGMLHDIGKLGLPDSLLALPYVALTPEQRRIVDRHPLIGQSIFIGLDPLQRAASFIRSHHERPDGRGFPDRLMADAIPKGALVVAAVSDFDALRSGAFTGERLSVSEAMAYLTAGRDSQYDRAVVDALSELLAEHDIGASTISERSLEPIMLEAGMVLSRDLVSRAQILLLSKGHRLTDSLIGKLLRYSREQDERLLVHVYAPEEVSDETDCYVG